MADDKKKDAKPVVKPGAKAAKKERITKKYKPSKLCPKCGAGVHLAEHTNRRACGKCGYFEKK